MAGAIYLVQSSGELVEMTEHAYEAEEVLQKLLSDYPSLLAGDQVNPSAPRRWLLVKQEHAVPSDHGSGARWWLDHLFLDQDAVPTLIEVKRSTDTRIRREVVGQMLDYAANAVMYWPADSMQVQFESDCRGRGQDPDTALSEFLDDERDAEWFWTLAKTNLQAGRVRMVFVADSIPPELERIVEFLNGQMNPAEVLALEVPRFLGQGHQVLVPRLVGRTAKAQQVKSVSRSLPARQWDEPSFFAELLAQRGEAETAAARETLHWARSSGLRIQWGSGKERGSCYLMVDHAGDSEWTVSIWTVGSVDIEFTKLVSRSKQVSGHPFETEAQRMVLLEKLNSLPGVALEPARVSTRPWFDLAVLVDPVVRRQFFDILGWVVAELRSQGTA